MVPYSLPNEARFQGSTNGILEVRFTLTRLPHLQVNVVREQEGKTERYTKQPVPWWDLVQLEETMNKSELIDALSDKSGLTKADAGRAVSAFVDVITETLAGGDKVTVPGFGTFKASQRSARTARNPKTGAPIHVPAHTAPTFKASKALKDAINA